MRTATPIVVFSHLRWRSVFQRPQQIMTRLARRHGVLFVEEPVFESGPPGLDVLEVADGVRVCRPHTPLRESGFGARQNESIAPLLLDLLRREGVKSFTAWMYTPMATSLAARLGPAAVIYDCMDDLTGFHGAPPELVAEERALLARADLVFTGGPSLDRAKRDLHRAVHCFPSSVDVAHFAPRPGLAHPVDLDPLPRPRLGYFGVIDERLDLPLVAALAAAHPDWSVVLIGPVAKIDPETLPRRANLHWLGPREYVELPRYAAAWDVCLMPFALNRATRYISPTKSLEYMAAERPIVSTPITNVVEPYGAIVHIGDGLAGFVAACERALVEDDDARATRMRLAAEVLARTSWDATVARMDALVGALDLTRGGPAPPPDAPLPVMASREGA